MRIRDWSSDVCSSDLARSSTPSAKETPTRRAGWARRMCCTARNAGWRRCRWAPARDPTNEFKTRRTELKIANIKASLHRHEIDLPGIGESIETRMFVFVEVETEDGQKGMGVTGSFLPWAVMPCIEEHIFPLIKGKDVRHTEAIHHLVWKQLNNRAYTGVISNALSAIDIACWDLRGKVTGLPVAELLGGFSNEAYTYAT